MSRGESLQDLQTTTHPQLGLLDGLLCSTIHNNFLEKLDVALGWQPLDAASPRMYPADTGRPPHPPLVLFKMSQLPHDYDLSDP